jgi:hypothetical protein
MMLVTAATKTIEHKRTYINIGRSSNCILLVSAEKTTDSYHNEKHE